MPKSFLFYKQVWQSLAVSSYLALKWLSPGRSLPHLTDWLHSTDYIPESQQVITLLTPEGRRTGLLYTQVCRCHINTAVSLLVLPIIIELRWASLLHISPLSSSLNIVLSRGHFLFKLETKTKKWLHDNATLKRMCVLKRDKIEHGQAKRIISSKLFYLASWWSIFILHCYTTPLICVLITKRGIPPYLHWSVDILIILLNSLY